jgi:RNA polymerase sigma-70 factor (ECF subfamily)
MEDRDLVLAVRAGDPTAFGRLVERYEAAIYRLCRRVTGNAADAEELAHDSFVEAWIKLHQLREPEKFASWLKRLALNLCRMWYRRRQRERPTTSDGQPAPDASFGSWSPAVPRERSDPAATRVRGGLSLLSPAHRLVLVLHYWEGLTYEELATFLGVPPGTVMSRLHRARRQLKEQIEAMEESLDTETEPMPEEGLKREVEAEIAVLLSLFGEQTEARERLGVIVRRSPERLAQLMEQAADEKTLADLALLLRRLGRPAIETVLRCYLSSGAQMRERAATVLRHFVNTGKSGPDGAPLGRMARREAYDFADALLSARPAPETAARLLDDLLSTCAEERTALLLSCLLLSFPDEALPLLLARFWKATAPEELYRTGSTLYTLCRTGTRFAAALLEPLRAGDARELSLALAGAEGMARALRLGLDLQDPSPERAALEARFRWKWGPPLPADRDTAVLSALAECLAERLEDPHPAVREAALRALGALRAEQHRRRMAARVMDDAPAVRLAALRTLAEVGDAEAPALLLGVARDGGTAERREAIRALGRLRAGEAEPLLTTLLEHPEPEIGRAAVFAIGEIGSGAAHARLRELVSRPGPLREAAARALHGGAPGASVEERRAERRRSSSGTMTRRIRGDEQPPFYIALDAAIRALPRLSPYDERELSRHIAAVCSDWASTRRRLVEEGLMLREAGIYRFTEWGEAIWRVERFLREGGRQ